MSACHRLYLNNVKEFYSLLQNRDVDLTTKMVKCVLNASKRNKDKVDIFEITFKNLDVLIFSIEKIQYKELLSNCLQDMIDIEDYELCAEMKKQIDKKERKKREVKVK